MSRPRCALVALVLVLSAGPAQAKLITITPADDYTKIEAAAAGDVVEIAPGTYKFRVRLTSSGSASNPIIIRAADPAARPVWDLAGKPVSDWPGSYSGGDRGRGCWQVTGDHYQISGIEFRNCQDSSSAGIRAVNSGPLLVRDCLFAGNTNGLTGSSSDLVIEHCELFDNGKQQAGNPSHNIYVYGGKLTVRYSLLRDPTEGQNFHVRAADALLEYNWITRPASYPGDVMSCETLCGGSGSDPITQKMVLRGNVIVQGQPSNRSQIVALFNDSPSGSSDGTGKVSKMELTLIHNTIVGTPLDPGKTQRLVNMRNDGVDTTVHLHNNIIYELNELAVPADAGLSNWSVDGNNNWVSASTSAGTGLTGTITGADPGFSAPGSDDYTLAAGSPCLGKAAAVAGLPDREYFRDEVVKLQYRLRASASDIGAFEQGTSGPGVGPNGTSPPPTDAGPGPDSTVDASPGPDSTVDASPGPDSTVDAGPGSDSTVDAGPGPDSTVDAGPEPDGTVAPDTMLTDTAAGPDAPPASDAAVEASTADGAAPDTRPGADATGDTGSSDASINDAGAGGTLAGESGCGCHAGEGEPPPLLALSLLLVCLVSLRRRTTP